VEAVDFVEQKLAAMRVHAGQMGPDHFLLALPNPMFALGMGVEFYIVDLIAARRRPGPLEELFTPPYPGKSDGPTWGPATVSRASIPE
jgi:LmbE family N-acetylglucosaminyl deacetylase